MIHSLATTDLYTSLPSEQRLKTLTELAEKRKEPDKNIPVYLQVERAKNLPSEKPYSVVV